PWLHYIGLECGARRRASDRTSGSFAGHFTALRSTQGRPDAAGECEGNAVKLRDLLPDAAADARQGAIDISGVTADSRKVKPGFLFVAIAGAKADGAHFARQAVEAGAAAVAAEQRPVGLAEAVAFVRVRNPRRALALAAAKVFPHQPSAIAAVTG